MNLILTLQQITEDWQRFVGAHRLPKDIEESGVSHIKKYTQKSKLVTN